MVGKITKHIVDRMIALDVIDPIDEKYYIYRLSVLTETAFIIFSLLMIALVFGRLNIMIFFLITYLGLRRYTGGVHLDSYSKCYFASVVVFSGVVYIVPALSMNKYFLLITLLAVLAIFVIGTVNHPNLNMDTDEVIYMKKKARICLFIVCMILIILKAFKFRETYLIASETAIIICAFFMIAAKMFKQEGD